MDQPLPSSPSAQRSALQVGGGMVILAYAITIFTSAFLLFQVQPLISKFILPWFGGSPAVWTAAMLFFQVVLFGGYLYAHLTSTWLTPRGQFVLHLVLLAAATVLALYTQISPSEALKPRGDESSPMLLILAVMGTSVGVPYFALSSTGPLLQKWFSDAFAGVSPYRLFALSNVGSLLALLSYPFFFEVHWDSRQQAVMWSCGFAVFAVCCAFCAWWTFRARHAHAAQTAKSPAVNAAQDQAAPTWWLWVLWILLPALASVMFLAVTNEVCQNVATVPLLWIIPLSLYLLSFIVAFDHPRWYVRPLCTIGAMVLLLYLANFGEFAGFLGEKASSLLGRSGDNQVELDGWVAHALVYFLALLLVCLVCHCELAGLKPSPRYLTSYFLSMSLGGAIGGILVNLVAPYVFTTFFELPLAFLAAVVVAGAALVWSVARVESRALSAPLAAGAALVSIAALCGVAYWQIDFSQVIDPEASRAIIYRGRNFFGLVSVQHRSRHEPQWSNYAFRSGHIVHGRQLTDPARRHETDLAYWGQGTGCRLALEFKVQQQPQCRLGVVGLGVGTIAAFAKPTDYVRLYEINPKVIEIAKNYFHFLEDCKAPKDIVLGDARLKLEEELKESGGKGNQFDVLCLDAFSGDAVPTHLLTTEAFQLYKQHLKPDGIIVCNITNTYLDLYPVVKKLAAEHGFKHTRVYRPRPPDPTLAYRTYFVLLTNDEAFLRQTPPTLVDMPADFQKERNVPLWTDRYHNLFQVLR